MHKAHVKDRLLIVTAEYAGKLALAANLLLINAALVYFWDFFIFAIPITLTCFLRWSAGVTFLWTQLKRLDSGKNLIKRDG